MSLSLAAWLVILVALAAANLPFASERVFGFVPLPAGKGGKGGKGGTEAGQARTQPFALRLLELLVLYFLVGALAYALESGIGNVFAQRWEFYAISGCLFLVLAFPGFVFRYLRKKRV